MFDGNQNVPRGTIDKLLTKYGKRGVRPKIVCGPTMTDASFKDECSIDRIIYKYTHNLPLEQWQVRQGEAVFADVSKVPRDPAEVQEWMLGLESRFLDMPAELRREYHDDVNEFLRAMYVNSNDAVQRAGKMLDEQKKVLNPTLSRILEESAARQKIAMAEALKEVKENEAKAPVNA